MKRLFVILLAVLLLAGCSNADSKHYAKISNENEVVFKYPDGKEYTKGDLFETLKKYDFTSFLLTDLLKTVGEAEGFDIEAMEKDADDYVEELKQYGDYFIQYYGGEERVKSTLIASDILTEITEIYFNENFDQINNEYKPVKAQVASFADRESAEATLEKVAEGYSLDATAIENNSINDPITKIYCDDSSSLPLDIKSYMLSSDSKGMSDIIEVETANADGTSNKTYYIVNILDKDVNNYKQEFAEYFNSVVDSDLIYNFAFGRHDIKFYDQDVYKLAAAAYEGLQ